MRFPEQTDAAFIARIEEILDEIGIPKSLADIGIP